MTLPVLRSPRSIREIGEWARANDVTLADANRRFAQFAVLRVIASSRRLSESLSFKGGNALDLVWHPNRSTQDLDFSVTEREIEIEAMRGLFIASLEGVASELGIAMQLQRFRLNPPHPGRSWPTLELTVGYALPGETANLARVSRSVPVANVVPVEISINEVVGARCQVAIDGGHQIYICSLEDIVAEKLRAFLQQKPRNRQRGQDVLDVAVIVQSGRPMNLKAVSEFLRLKAEARGVAVTKAAFRDPELWSRAQANYEDLRDTTRKTFIDFKEASSILLKFVDSLPMDEL